MTEKLSGDKLLENIKENFIADCLLIKSCGYSSLNQEGDEIPLVEDFFQEHTKALQAALDRGEEIPFYDFPEVTNIGLLPKGKYLIGDLIQSLSIADKNLIEKVQAFKENLILDVSDLIDFQEQKIDGKWSWDIEQAESKYDGISGFLDSSKGSKYLYIGLDTDESEYEDNKGRYYFQQTATLGCVKVPENFKNENTDLQCIDFDNDFSCIYYSSYGILKLADLYLYSK